MRWLALLFVAQMAVGGSACATELASGLIVNGLQWADTAGVVRSGAWRSTPPPVSS
jgi:hypothetical protein